MFHSDWTARPVLQILLQTGDPRARGRPQACVQVREECTRMERTGDVNFTDTYFIYFSSTLHTLACLFFLIFYQGFSEILSTYGLNIDCVHLAWTSFPDSTLSTALFLAIGPLLFCPTIQLARNLQHITRRTIFSMVSPSQSTKNQKLHKQEY